MYGQWIRGYSVSLGYNDSPKNLEIPSRYNGKPVLKIDSSAFNGCQSLLSVILPNTIVYISEYAFAHCTNLTRIDIKSGIISIGNYAFYCCDGLTSINLPDSLTSIGTDIFANCVSLENVTLPSGITSIKVREFSNCINLTSIFIPKSVTTIADGAFNNCYNIQTVYYGGTSNEWFNITIGIYNEYIINANLICSKDSELSRHTTANEYFNFTLLSDGTYSITAKDENNIPEGIVLPSTYNGREVSVIGEAAFAACGELMSISVEQGKSDILQ